MSRRNDNTGAVLGSLIVGALAGAAAALLFAPQSGDETREKLAEEADRLKKEIEKYANDFSDKAKEAKAELEHKLKRTQAELRDAEESFNA